MACTARLESIQRSERGFNFRHGATSPQCGLRLRRMGKRQATTRDLWSNVARQLPDLSCFGSPGVLDASSTGSVLLRCARRGRAAVAMLCVPPQRRLPAPYLHQRILETDWLPARTDDAVAPPASADLAKEAALNRHKFPSIRQTRRQPAREGQAVILRGPISPRAFPGAAENLLSGRERPVPVDRQVKPRQNEHVTGHRRGPACSRAGAAAGEALGSPAGMLENNP